MILVHQAIPSVWEAHFQEARLAGQKGQNINEAVRGEGSAVSVLGSRGSGCLLILR